MLSFSAPATRRLTAARAFAVAALCMVPVSTALTNVFCGLFAAALVISPSSGATCARSSPTRLRSRRC